ncbi:MAG: type II TA system antitoxin MqsA family protein [Armatimonadota bacterium]
MKPYPAYKDSGVEWIGEIPRHWEMRKVSRAFDYIGSGTTPDTANRNYYNGGTAEWVVTGDLNDGLLTESSKKITELALKNFSALKQFPKGSVLIAMYGATIGKVAIADFVGYCNQACCVLSKSDYCKNKFVFYWFIVSKQNIISLSIGGGQPNISQDIIRTLKIPCPPNNEQRGIIDYLVKISIYLKGGAKMKKNRNQFCQECGQEKTLEEIRKTELINVRGEEIPVEVIYCHCNSCAVDFENLDDKNDYLDLAYRKYRQRHDMIQPEGIKKLRKKYELTQTEMAKLLGWGNVTLARYEKGALQDHAHDKALKFLTEPRNVYALLKQNPESVDKEKYNKLKNYLVACIEKEFEKDLIKTSFDYFGDKFSGFSAFSFEKFINMVLFFCKGGIFKTKLNKLLFYADFKHFKNCEKSISGIQYIHAAYGPVPKLYSFLLAYLIENKLIDIDEVEFGHDKHNKEVLGEEFNSMVNSDLNLFSDSEIQTLIEIKNYFSSFGSKKISEFSHEEPAYKLTQNGEMISYEYAKELNL